MKTLFKNGFVINVFTDEIEESNVLIEDGKIIGVGDYSDADADKVVDVSGKYLCPCFIDGHIHIESTMLTPASLAKIALPHGTTTIIADPHEIANVCGKDGIRYMLAKSEGLPLSVYIMLPSCVPSTAFDESGAVLNSEDLEEFYKHKRVLGLAEMMNYPGVLYGDESVYKKLDSALENNAVIDGHAPLLSGKGLDKYLSYGIDSDHECSTLEEGMERIKKGQWVMIRQGTAAKNLFELLPLFDEPYNRRCLLVTDDRHPADIINDGEIDNIIRKAIKYGKSPLVAIRMATLQAAQRFGLRFLGAIAPGYKADILVLDELETVKIKDVYTSGKKVVADGVAAEIREPEIDKALEDSVLNSFKLNRLNVADFYIENKSNKCRVIKIIPNQILTEELITEINFDKNNGIDLQRDILKLAVIERHNNTGHKGLGFISGIGLKKGAIASSVSHDSHNLIVIGTNDSDMAFAANHIIEIGGGSVVVVDRKIISDMPLPIAGLMTDIDAKEISEKNKQVRVAVDELGVAEGVEPFMNMAFVSLTVIPSLKMSTLGLVDVENQKTVSLFI